MNPRSWPPSTADHSTDHRWAVLAAGHQLVATGRDTERPTQVLGSSDDLLPVQLDVTRPADADAAVHAAVDRFGRIDVLVDNAAGFEADCFEELTPQQIDRQLATSPVGPMHVTRAVLPVMRRQRTGHVIAISSSAGLAAGSELVCAYAASKLGLEGWMESLAVEVAPSGIHTTIVNPGFFRTELLTARSTNYAEPSVADYDEIERDAQRAAASRSADASLDRRMRVRPPHVEHVPQRAEDVRRAPQHEHGRLHGRLDPASRALVGRVRLEADVGRRPIVLADGVNGLRRREA